MPASRTRDSIFCVMSCSPCPGVSKLNCLTIRARFERRDGGKLLALEEVEEGAAGGRDVVDALVDLELVDRGDRVAAAGDRERLRARDRFRERLRPLGERLLLDYAPGPVPHEGAELGRAP